MYQVFIGILPFAFLALIAGLVKPTLFNPIFRRSISRKFIGLVFGLTMVALTVLGMITTPQSVRDAQKLAAQSTPSAQPKVQETTQSTPVPTSKPTEAPKSLTMQQKLEQAVDTGLKSRKNIKVEYDAPNKLAFITHINEKPTSAEAFVRQDYSILVLWGREAFKIDGVDRINIQNQTTITDAYGHDNTQTGVTIEMTKTQFQQFNWDNLKFQAIDSNIRNASDIYIIIPAIRNAIKDMSKLYLVLSYP